MKSKEAGLQGNIRDPNDLNEVASGNRCFKSISEGRRWIWLREDVGLDAVLLQDVNCVKPRQLRASF